MTLESLEFRRSSVSKSITKAKSITVIGAIVLTIILVFGVATALSTGLPSSYSSTKNTLCTAKVLELAQKGIIREVGGYYGALYECTHMHSMSSVYGIASS
jgi:hypothetical protein